MSNMLVNILQTKCPRCHKGDLFESKNPYHFGKMTATKTHCQSCGLKYEIEPGFFFGAMYISYALNVALFVFFMLFVLDDKISTVRFLAYYGITSAILYPIIFRLSRTIWAHILIKFEPNKISEY